jgi:hypothetical protein
MTPKKLSPRQALNKAFLKVKPIRENIETFKTNLIKLIDTTTLEQEIDRLVYQLYELTEAEIKIVEGEIN